MKSIITRPGPRCRRARSSTSFLKIVAFLVVFGAIAHGESIDVFWDDFEGHETGTNPNLPPIGEPWQISEVADDGIYVADGQLTVDNRVLRFGRYRNSAVAPISPADQGLIAEAQNLRVSFDYVAFSSPEGYSHYFDVAAYAPTSSDPAFMIRFAPQENQGAPGLHDVYYLDPADGLVDSGLDVLGDDVQTVTITADFALETYDLDIGGLSTSLPVFYCPEDIVADVEFANYAVAMGSASSIDNVRIDIASSKTRSSTPEPSTIVMLAVAGLALASAWILSRKSK